MEIAPGAFHLPRYLSLENQRVLLARCRALMDGDVPGYVPTVRGGGSMHVRMLCLGRHWNGLLYKYETSRSDFDGLPAPPLPGEFRRLANEIAASVGMLFDADLCILNYYDGAGRMGVHQDKDESPTSLAAGHPVVSVSVGDTARFLFGGCAGGILWTRFCSNQGMASYSEVPRGSAITACRASRRARPRRHSASKADSI